MHAFMNLLLGQFPHCSQADHSELRILPLCTSGSPFGPSQVFTLAFLNTIYIPLILKRPRCALVSHLSVHMG